MPAPWLLQTKFEVQTKFNLKYLLTLAPLRAFIWLQPTRRRDILWDALL